MSVFLCPSLCCFHGHHSLHHFVNSLWEIRRELIRSLRAFSHPHLCGMPSEIHLKAKAFGYWLLKMVWCSSSLYELSYGDESSKFKRSHNGLQCLLWKGLLKVRIGVIAKGKILGSTFINLLWPTSHFFNESSKSNEIYFYLPQQTLSVWLLRISLPFIFIVIVYGEKYTFTVIYLKHSYYGRIGNSKLPLLVFYSVLFYSILYSILFCSILFI